MNLLSKLKQLSVKNVLLKSLAFIAAGVIVFVALGGVDFAKAKLQKPVDIYDLSIDELDGAYVSAEIYFLFDLYAYTEETKDGQDTGKITSKEYVIPVGDSEYMGVQLPAKYFEQSDRLLEECNTYFVDGTSPTVSFVVEGTISRMDYETLNFYHETVGYDDADSNAEYKALFLPYYLKADTINEHSVSSLYICVALSGVLVMIGVYTLLRALTGGYQSKLKKTVAAMGERDFVLDELEHFYENTEPVGNVRINEKWVIYQKGAESVLLLGEDIVWAYQSTTTHRVYGVPCGKTHCVTLCTAQGAQYQVAMKTEKQTQDVLQELQSKLDGLLVGYSAELETLYRKDRASFLAHRKEKSQSSNSLL